MSTQAASLRCSHSHRRLFYYLHQSTMTIMWSVCLQTVFSWSCAARLSCIITKEHNSQHLQCVYSRNYKVYEQERKLFAKEPKLAKLLWRLKCWTLRKANWVFSYICNGKLAVFWVLCCGITCKWVLFFTIDVFFDWLAWIYMFIVT